MKHCYVKSLILFLILSFCSLSVLSIIQAQIYIPKKKGSSYSRAVGKRRIPSPTEQGTFKGTWYYIDRDKRFAFFIKEENGKNKIKIRWILRSEESFETDWNGKCQYKFRGYDGKVNMEISNPENKDDLKGKWEWTYATESIERMERSSFQIYRAENGYKLVWMLPDFERVIIRKGKKPRKYAYADMHILRKASDRIIDWEDIPF